MKRISLKAVLVIVAVGTATACATIGDQRGQAPEARKSGLGLQPGAAGDTRVETETERFFRQQDEASRYAR